MKPRKRIKALSIKEYSGFVPKIKSVDVLKRNNHFIEESRSITGDAPKHFIRVYEYGKCVKKNTQSWLLYIAKHGHKYYPAESITEYLLNRIGETLGFQMAESRLVWIGGQIRFCSKYFLFNEKEEELIHAADIYAGYLSDKQFIDEVANRKEETDFFTVQFTKEALIYLFPEQGIEIFRHFINMLFFDALVGVMDRHIYNWGVIRCINKKVPVRFSPIFDTSRGLFWNHTEESINKDLLNIKTIGDTVHFYAERCSPRVGWDHIKKINHFKLLELLIIHGYVGNIDTWKNICSVKSKQLVLDMIDNEFYTLFSKNRILLIKACIEYRFAKISLILS